MRALDIVAISKRIAHTLDQLGEEVTMQKCLSEDAAILRTDQFDLRIQIERKRHVDRLDMPADHYIEVTLMREFGPPWADAEPYQAIMAYALAALHVPLAPDFVQWIEPGALLTRAEFRAAITPPQESERVRTRVRRGRDRLPNVEEAYTGLQGRIPHGGNHSAEDAERLRSLRAAFCEPETEELPDPSAGIREETAPLRLSVWMMTFTLAIFALPVAAGLMVFNLLRGENLRLASQTAALTGLFMSLQASGAMAEAVEMVRGLGV